MEGAREYKISRQFDSRVNEQARSHTFWDRKASDGGFLGCLSAGAQRVAFRAQDFANEGVKMLGTLKRFIRDDRPFR